jgi:mRNA interferase MazF
VAVITGNLELAGVPGNVPMPARTTGLPRDSVVNISQLLTLDHGFLTELAGTLPRRLQGAVDEGLRLVLQL